VEARQVVEALARELMEPSVECSGLSPDYARRVARRALAFARARVIEWEAATTELDVRDLLARLGGEE